MERLGRCRVSGSHRRAHRVCSSFRSTRRSFLLTCSEASTSLDLPSPLPTISASRKFSPNQIHCKNREKPLFRNSRPRQGIIRHRSCWRNMEGRHHQRKGRMKAALQKPTLNKGTHLLQGRQGQLSYLHLQRTYRAGTALSPSRVHPNKSLRTHGTNKAKMAPLLPPQPELHGKFLPRK